MREHIFKKQLFVRLLVRSDKIIVWKTNNSSYSCQIRQNIFFTRENIFKISQNSSQTNSFFVTSAEFFHLTHLTKLFDVTAFKICVSTVTCIDEFPSFSLVIVLDEYLNLYYCTWENFQMLHKMYIEWLFGRWKEMKFEQVGERVRDRKGEKQYSTSGSAIVWFLLFNGNKFLFVFCRKKVLCFMIYKQETINYWMPFMMNLWKFLLRLFSVEKRQKMIFHS